MLFLYGIIFFRHQVRLTGTVSYAVISNPHKIIDEVCRLYDVETSTLLKSKRDTTNETRNVAIYHTRLFCKKDWQ